ncbi:hypothetical protein ACVRW4_01925 [Streptococcus phocae subsp. phocae]
MKEYIIDIIESGRLAVLTFGKEDSQAYDTLVDKRDGDENLIELSKKAYNTSYLINLDHVRYVKSKEISKRFNGF